MTKATNRGTTAPGRNSTYQLADGRYSRFLNGQWRVPNTDLALAKIELRLDNFPSPQYRIKDHHWWSDFHSPDDPVTTAFGLLADAAFVAYDFGEGVSVTDTSGWEYTDPGTERTCKVFVESEGKVNDPGPPKC